MKKSLTFPSIKKFIEFEGKFKDRTDYSLIDDHIALELVIKFTSIA